MIDYPDISDILARKAEGRRDLAQLDFWDKVRRMEALRERVRFLKELREADRRDKATPSCGAEPGPHRDR